MKRIFGSATKMVLIIMFFQQSAFAYGGNSGVLFGLSTLFYNEKSDGPTIGDGDSKRTLTDFKLGYLNPNNLYLGLNYSSVGYTYNSSIDVKRKLLGFSVGYHSGGYFIDGTYFFSGDYTASSTVAFKEGTGIGIDFGYNQTLSSNFFMGLEVSYKSITYKKVESGSSSINEDNKQPSDLYPMINLGFIF